jgi:glycosyltransferase involved in cell wall biosynthesis
MKIALDATYGIDRNPSGVGVYSREILHGIAAAHPETRFLFCYRPHRFLRSFQSPLPDNCSRRLLHEPLVPRSADLFHGLNQRLPEAALRRTVTTFHDLFVITGDYSTPEFRRRFERQAKDAAARSDLIIAVSEFTARQVQNCLGVPPERLRVIHHGVRLPESEPPGAEARERIVLHVGAIQKRKNIIRLVRAFEQMSNEWRLVLAGSLGYGSAEILRAIEASPARDRIDVLGYTPEAELRRWYRRAAVFAFPSLDEGFGMPVLEAMAWNVPVLTSDRSALPEVSGDAARAVDPEDVEAMALNLKELGSDQELRKEMQLRGRRRVADFTWKSAVSKTWAVYSELLRRRQ